MEFLSISFINLIILFATFPSPNVLDGLIFLLKKYPIALLIFDNHSQLKYLFFFKEICLSVVDLRVIHGTPIKEVSSNTTRIC